MSPSAVASALAQGLAQSVPIPTPGGWLGGWLGDPVALTGLVAGASLLIYFMVLRPKLRNGKRVDPLTVAPSRRASLAGERAAERQTRELVTDLAELERATRRMLAQLDAKTQRLEALIREADQKTGALSAAVAQARAGQMAGEMVSRMGVGTFGANHESGLAALARHREVYDLADAGEAASAIAQKLRRPAGEVELILALRGTGGAIS